MPRCPVCSVEIDLDVVLAPPFCSERCRVIDLGRWLDEAYAVPEKPRDDEDGDGEEPIPPLQRFGDDDES